MLPCCFKPLHTLQDSRTYAWGQYNPAAAFKQTLLHCTDQCPVLCLHERVTIRDSNTCTEPARLLALKPQIGCDVPPSGSDVEVLCLSAAVGIEADKERVAALLKELQGKDIAAVIAEGNKKLASIPSGGGAAPAAAAAAPKADDKKAAPKKVEKEPSEEEEVSYAHHLRLCKGISERHQLGERLC